jgi:sensor domain CHASE-containing protein
MWDDAVRNLDNRYNHVWASENIGAYLNKTGGFDDIFLLDPSDRPIYAATAGADAPIDRYTGFSATVASLLARARAAEAKRGPLPKAPEPNGVLAKPIQESAIVEANGVAYIAVATVVTPDFGRARPLGRRAPKIIHTHPSFCDFGSSLNYVQRTRAAMKRGVMRFKLTLCSQIAT